MNIDLLISEIRDAISDASWGTLLGGIAAVLIALPRCWSVLKGVCRVCYSPFKSVPLPPETLSDLCEELLQGFRLPCDWQGPDKSNPGELKALNGAVALVEQNGLGESQAVVSVTLGGHNVLRDLAPAECSRVVQAVHAAHDGYRRWLKERRIAEALAAAKGLKPLTQRTVRMASQAQADLTRNDALRGLGE